MEATASSLKKEIRILNERFLATKKEQDDLLASVNNLKLEKEEFERTNKILERKLDTIKQEIERHKKELDSKGAMLEEQTVIINESNATITRLKAEITGLNETKGNLTQEYRTIRESEEARLAELVRVEQNKVGVLEARRIDLTRQIQGDEAVIADLDRDYKGIVAKKEALELELDGITKLIKEEEIRYENIKKDIEAQETRLESLSEQRTVLENRIKELDMEARTKTDVIGALNAEITATQGLLADTKSQYEVEKMKLFSIAERERNATQREAYIKSKYEEAGIPYQ